jgi:hypothetical protein
MKAATRPLFFAHKNVCLSWLSGHNRESSEILPMYPLYYKSSQGHANIYHAALLELDDMGMTALWFAENYPSNLRAIQLEMDMGMQGEFDLRVARADEHPLLPVAEFFRELMLKPPYQEQLFAIPVHWPRGFILNCLTSTRDNKFQNDYRLSAMQLASQDVENRYFYYLNGCATDIGFLPNLTEEQVNLLLVANPWAIIKVKEEQLNQYHWDIALAKTDVAFREYHPSRFSKPALIQYLNTQPHAFNSMHSEKGVTLTELGLNHDELVKIARKQIFDPSEHIGIFSDDEMVSIIAINEDNNKAINLVRAKPGLAIKMTKALEYDGKRRNDLLFKIETSILRSIVNSGEVDFNQIPQTLHAVFEEDDPAIAKKILKHGDRSEYDCPF